MASTQSTRQCDLVFGMMFRLWNGNRLIYVERDQHDHNGCNNRGEQSRCKIRHQQPHANDHNGNTQVDKYPFHLAVRSEFII